MRLELQPDIQEVAEFMQRNIPAARLVSVAAGLHAIAPLLWKHYRNAPPDDEAPLSLRELPITQSSL